MNSQITETEKLMDLRALDFKKLDDEQIYSLLTVTGELQQKLFSYAREVRAQYFGDALHVRGVIEISNICTKNCNYCAMRCHNNEVNRYRLDAETIMAVARQIVSMGIGIVFLQSGQNPIDDEILYEVIPQIAELGVEVLLCVGERKEANIYKKYAELGANSYIIKFEASDSDLYQEIANTSLEKRIKCMEWVKEAGMKLGTGNIQGLPKQTMAHLIKDIRLGIELGPDFVSTSPFIPNNHTPFENHVLGDIDLTLNTMAIWRIALKNVLIPTVSALEYIHEDGQLMGLNAGANVMTINFTPKNVREKYKIYSEDRFIVNTDHVKNMARRAGMTTNL